MPSKRLFALPLAALALAACSSTSTTSPAADAAPAPSTPAAAPAATSTPSPSASSACVDVPAAMRSSILDGVKPEVGHATASSWGAVKVSDGYFVAARVTVPGAKPTPVVFRLPSGLDSGPVLSADTVAASLFDWPKPGDYPRDDVDAARSCLS